MCSDWTSDRRAGGRGDWTNCDACWSVVAGILEPYEHFAAFIANRIRALAHEGWTTGGVHV